MPNPRLAARYAKSLIDLSMEKGQLEQVYKDILYLKSIFKSSKELVNFLNNPVITSDQKLKVVKAVDSENTGEITKSFNRLLIRKGRESYLPEIADALLSSTKNTKEYIRLHLTTAIPVSDDVKNIYHQTNQTGRPHERSGTDNRSAGKYHWRIYPGRQREKNRRQHSIRSD